MSHGGKRQGSGRKSKAEEVRLIDSLTPLAPEALKALKNGIEAGEFPFVKLFYEYYAGKPTDKVDVTSNGKTLESKHEIIFKDYSKDAKL
jgi:hypothetical protein